MPRGPRDHFRFLHRFGSTSFESKTARYGSHMHTSQAGRICHSRRERQGQSRKKWQGAAVLCIAKVRRISSTFYMETIQDAKIYALIGLFRMQYERMAKKRIKSCCYSSPSSSSAASSSSSSNSSSKSSSTSSFDISTNNRPGANYKHFATIIRVWAPSQCRSRRQCRSASLRDRRRAPPHKCVPAWGVGIFGTALRTRIKDGSTSGIKIWLRTVLKKDLGFGIQICK
jgi:hypothetical protein